MQIVEKLGIQDFWNRYWFWWFLYAAVTLM